MVPEVQVTIITEEGMANLLIQHLAPEITTSIIPEILQTIQLETIIIIRQEITVINNLQEAIVMNLLLFVLTLQVRIILVPHLHTVAEVMVVEAAAAEDLHLVVEEDKKIKTQISMLLNKFHRYFFE